MGWSSSIRHSIWSAWKLASFLKSMQRAPSWNTSRPHFRTPPQARLGTGYISNTRKGRWRRKKPILIPTKMCVRISVWCHLLRLSNYTQSYLHWNSILELLPASVVNLSARPITILFFARHASSKTVNAAHLLQNEPGFVIWGESSRFKIKPCLCASDSLNIRAGSQSKSIPKLLYSR